MTDEQYWRGDPYLAVAYRDAQAIEEDNTNFNLWLQGKYVYEAMCTTLHNAFRKAGEEIMHYPQEPYRLKPLTEEEQRAEDEKEIQKIIDNLNAMQRSLNG